MIELVRLKMAEIASGDSDIDRYALTNEAEFFAVASEYFFERPGVMERKHPEPYADEATRALKDAPARQALLELWQPIGSRFAHNGAGVVDPRGRDIFDDHGEYLSPEVLQAIPKAARRIRSLARLWARQTLPEPTGA